MSQKSKNPLHDKIIVLGVSGGIAAYKACDLASKLRQSGAEVSVIMTNAAQQFVTPLTFQSLTHRPVITSLFTSLEEWEIEHISLAQRASLAVITPATANVIGKLACGIADDFLTTFVLATRAPILICPAMNCDMYTNPVVQENLDRLRARGFHIEDPEEGMLACGDVGKGRLASVEKIFERIVALVARSQDFSGVKILVTAGPTHEPIDPVRFVGNRSSGKMGFAVAREAFDRGADVTLVAGPDTVQPPRGPRLVRVETAEQMRRATLEAARDADVVVMAAAVADFRPETAAAAKLKKEAGPPELTLVATADILAELGAAKGDRVLVGFAAETGDLEDAGRAKLRSKGLDLIVVNEVGRPGTGFGSDTTHAAILAAESSDEPLRGWTKAELATAICDRLVGLLR